jgi:membrane-associated phospholipid phosphatase
LQPFVDVSRDQIIIGGHFDTIELNVDQSIIEPPAVSQKTFISLVMTYHITTRAAVSKSSNKQNGSPEYQATQSNVLRRKQKIPADPLNLDNAIEAATNRCDRETETVISPYGTVSFKEKKRWIYEVPVEFQLFFQKFDDSIISLAQWPLSTPLRRSAIYFSKSLTALTAIEFGLIFPSLFYLVRADWLATFSAILTLVTCLISQIPKRFLYRTRPWMDNRAIKLSKNKTSSFPSRAVICGTVYSAMCAAFFTNFDNTFIVTSVGLIGGILASYARILLGAHYPSDCLVGLLTGGLIFTISSALFTGQSDFCGHSIPAAHNALQIDWYSLILLFLSSIALVLAMMARPLLFWTKCSHVFGLLLPCLAFNFSCLCGKIRENSAAMANTMKFSEISPEIYILALISAGFAGFGGNTVNKIKRVDASLAVYCLLFMITYGILVYARIPGVSGAAHNNNEHSINSSVNTTISHL